MLNFFKTLAKIYEKPALLVGVTTGLVNAVNAGTPLVKHVKEPEQADQAFENLFSGLFIVGCAATSKAIAYGLCWPGTTYIFGWRLWSAIENNDKKWMSPMANLRWYDGEIFFFSNYVVRQERAKYRLPWTNPLYNKDTKKTNIANSGTHNVN